MVVGRAKSVMANPRGRTDNKCQCFWAAHLETRQQLSDGSNQTLTAGISPVAGQRSQLDLFGSLASTGGLARPHSERAETGHD